MRGLLSVNAESFIAGKTATLDDYKGKVVLLDFWATWCHGCKEEIPWFAEFQRKYSAKGLEVVGVSMDDGWPVVKDFLARPMYPTGLCWAMTR